MTKEQKRHYMITTAETAFLPVTAVEAYIDDYGNAFNVVVTLPDGKEPKTLLNFSPRHDLGTFIAQIKRLRGMVESEGVMLDPWEPPPFPA